jgi:hypothetical protein
MALIYNAYIIKYDCNLRLILIYSEVIVVATDFPRF